MAQHCTINLPKSFLLISFCFNSFNLYLVNISIFILKPLIKKKIFFIPQGQQLRIHIQKKVAQRKGCPRRGESEGRFLLCWNYEDPKSYIMVLQLHYHRRHNSCKRNKLQGCKESMDCFVHFWMCCYNLGCQDLDWELFRV